MKQIILSFFSLTFLLLTGNLNAQCGDSLESFCYGTGDGATEVQLATHCPDAGETLNIEFLSGDIEAGWDELFVHSGSASDITDPQIAGPIEGDLAGLAFSSANPGECITFGIISDSSVACSTGGRPEAEYAVSCDAIVFGCTDAGAENPTPGANFDNGSCTFAGDITHVATGSQTVTGCGPGNFYDTGGNLGQYAADENGTTIICPDDPATETIMITFDEFNIEGNGWDGLSVYDANTADAATQFDSGTGGGGGSNPDGVYNSETTGPVSFLALNSTGCLTFVFNSDGSGQFDGWAASYQCVTPPSCSDPADGVADNVTYDSADLSWTSSNTQDGDNTWSVYVGFPPADPTTGTGTTTTGLTETELAVTGLTESNTTYVFYVMENCGGVDGDSNWAGPFEFTTEPNFCGGDQFTDAGGATGNYPNSSIANGVAETTICPTPSGAPAGCDKVTVSFTEFAVEDNWDGLFIYDADSTDPAALIESGDVAVSGGLAPNSFNGDNNPGTITATNPTGCLTFFFDSDTSVPDEGWVADVVCGIPPVVTNDATTANEDGCFDLANTPNIFDPCSCNIPTEILDGTVVVLGNFNEELDVLGITPGATWTVTAGTGLNAPVGADGDTFNDVNGNGIADAGDTATDANNDGDIQITGTHDDGVGYDITLEDASGVFELSIGNLCNQPRPDVTDLPLTVCTNGVALPLEAIDALGSTPESVVFDLAGPTAMNGITELDPAALTPGNYTLNVTFNGDDLPSSDAPETVGCPVLASFSLQVLEGPASLSCNDAVNISLDDACSATVTPDVILEGADGCDPSFEVSIRDNFGADLGDVVDGSFVGEEWTVRVIELSTGNYCWGSILVEDKIAPTLTCPDVTLPCTAGTDPTSTDMIAVTNQFAIPANTPTEAGEFGYEVEVDVPAGPVLDVNIGVVLLDSDLGNLDIQVTSPDGTNITVIPGPNGCAGIGGNFDFILDDDAAPAANLLCSGGALQEGLPVNDPFLGDPSVFEGGEVSGTWTITINNLAADAVNDILSNVFLEITYNSTAAAELAVSAEDNCTANPSLTFVDQMVTGDCGEASGTLTRTWTATDDSGNTGQCIQTITLARPSLADVAIPADVTIDCAVATDAATAATMDGAGVPTINGLPIVNGDICNITSTLVSEIVIDDICPGTYKIRREWLVVDWCASAPDNEIFQVQYIKVLDGTGPAVANPGDLLPQEIHSIAASDNNSDAPHQVCEGYVTLPALTWSDDCTTVEEYTTSIFTLDGALLASIESNGGSLPNIPLYGPTGDDQPTYLAVYTATDACGNTTTYDEEFQTEDRVSPTCVLDEITQVSIGTSDYNNDGAGDAYINASVYDDGSYDNCTEVHFLVDRSAFAGDDQATGSLRFYSPHEVFDCSDIPGPQMTFVMVIDDWLWNRIQDPAQAPNFLTNTAPGQPFYNQFVPDFEQYLPAGSITAFGGHYNVCMVETLVEDKLAPYKIADVENDDIACDDYFTNYAPLLDVAEANGDNNPQFLIDAFGDVVYEDNCEAIVTTGWSRNVNSCGVGTITRTWSVVDPTGNQGQSCTQTINVFHVNDWNIQFPADQDVVCQAGQDEIEGVNFGEPTVFDDDCELIAISIEDETFNVVPDACYKVIRTYTAINWCIYDGDNQNDDTLIGTRRFRDGGDGIVTYNQNVKVNDNVAPVITNPGDQDYCIDGSTDNGNCTRNITLPEAEVTDCSDDISVTYTVAGLGTGRNYSNVAPGTYDVTVTAIDNCGNQSSIVYDVTVRDCKAPTPYCVGGLVAELMPMDEDGDGQADSGMVELWASDFDAGSFDNCTAQEDLKLRASSTDNGFDAAASNGNITFDCSNVGPNNVYLYIQDEAGNVDYCLTTVFIESVPNVCNNEDPVITGALATENGAALASASVSLNTGEATMTNNGGEYMLVAETGADVTVIPEHNVFDNTSVTTFDLVLIRQHILTTQLLDSPYKQIAADVNNSGAITAADLVAAKQVILGMATSYPNNNAWVFVDASYEFPADWNLSTDGYPAVVNFNNITVDQNDVDFVAVRVGDVNGTYGFGDDADERNSAVIRANDAELAAGQEFTVEFSSADIKNGYQFTLNYSGLEIVSIDGDAENFGVFADAITTSFEGQKESDKLFAVTFKATQAVQISNALTVNSRITKAEAYNAEGAAMGIALEFGDATATEFELYQNTPNPFKGATVIGFNLPTATAATLTITDISGKVLKVVEGEYAKGFNQVRISDLTATGVLYYQLDTEEFSATRKMVVIK